MVPSAEKTSTVIWKESLGFWVRRARLPGTRQFLGEAIANVESIRGQIVVPVSLSLTIRISQSFLSRRADRRVQHSIPRTREVRTSRMCTRKEIQGRGAPDGCRRQGEGSDKQGDAASVLPPGYSCGAANFQTQRAGRPSTQDTSRSTARDIRPAGKTAAIRCVVCDPGPSPHTGNSPPRWSSARGQRRSRPHATRRMPTSGADPTTDRDGPCNPERARSSRLASRSAVRVALRALQRRLDPLVSPHIPCERRGAESGRRPCWHRGRSSTPITLQRTPVGGEAPRVCNPTAARSSRRTTERRRAP